MFLKSKVAKYFTDVSKNRAKKIRPFAWWWFHCYCTRGKFSHFRRSLLQLIAMEIMPDAYVVASINLTSLLIKLLSSGTRYYL